MLLRRADRVVRTVSCGPPTAFVALFARERVRVCVCVSRPGGVLRWCRAVGGVKD